jgi:hypothetical protein
MKTFDGYVVIEEDRIYAEMWIGNNLLSYPLCKRDLDFYKSLDEEQFVVLATSNLDFIIVDGEAVIQEQENDREPELSYE